METPNTDMTTYQVEGRAGLIITLGVLALMFLGPFGGVPAWLMANRDLRDLRAGYISPAALGPLTTGRRLAIAGTFFSPLWILLILVVLFVAFIVAGEVISAMA
jgi:hypothetical protein